MQVERKLNDWLWSLVGVWPESGRSLAGVMLTGRQ